MKFNILLVSEDTQIMQVIREIANRNELTLISIPVEYNTVLKTLEQKVDLMIYDIHQDVKNHFDMIHVIKNLKPSLPIIMLTENNSFDNMKEIAQLSVFYCALKPLEAQEIQHVIKAVMAKMPYSICNA